MPNSFLGGHIMTLTAPGAGESKQDFLKRCMSGDENLIAECTAAWNEARLAAFVDEHEVTLSAGVQLVQLAEDDASSGPRRFSVLAYTGKLIDFGWWGRFIIDLSGMRMAKEKIPALMDHARSARLGVIDTAKNDSNGFYAMGSFLSSQLASDVLADMDEGFPFQASVGVRGLKVLQIKKGETHEVNGRTVEGPLDVWLESEVFETSFVTFGADDDTAAIAMHRAGGRDKNKEDFAMNPKLKKALVGLGLPAEATDEQAVKFLADMGERHHVELSGLKDEIAELKSAADKPAPETFSTPVKAEPVQSLSGADVIALQREFKALGYGSDAVNEALGDGRMTIDQARKLLVSKAAEINPPLGAGRLITVADESDKVRLAMTDGVCLRMGMSIEKPAAGHERFRAMTLHELARFDLERSGVLGVANMTARQVAERIIKLSMGGVSTSDFSSVFMDVAHKRMLKAYAEAPDTYTPWVNIVPASDFKTIYGISLSGAPDMELVGENGEYKTANLSDSQESYAVGKYGKIIPLTLEMIVNDDLRAFNRIPQLIGSSARRKIADTVYGKLLGAPTMSDGKALFHADHKNLETVAGNKGVVDTNKISAARAAMRLQKGLKGEPLDLRPKFLLVPVAQETSADILLRSAALPSENMSAGVKNPLAGKLEPIAEPRLDDVSSKAWYLVGDPAQIDTIELAFLDGESAPTVTENDEFVRDAISYKGRIIFGVGVMDYRGFFKNPGE